MSNRNQHSENTGNTKKEKTGLVISPRQSSSIIASTLIGVGVLTIPRVTASEANEAAWLTSFLGGCLSIIALIVITRLGFRFPRKNLAEYSAVILGSEKSKRNLLGKLLSAPIVLLFIAYWIIITAMIARTFGEVVVTAVLRQTPLEVIILTMLLTAMILVLYDVEVLARVNEILLPIIVIPVLFIVLLSFQTFELEYFLPVWPGLELTDFFKGVLLTLFAYEGYEVITVYSAHTHITKKSMRLNVIGLLIPTFLYTFIIIVGVGVFGNEELDLLMWPTLELVKVTQVPGLILERMESAFLGVWVAAVFTTTANVYYGATVLASQFFGQRKHRRWFGMAFLPILFWLSLQPQNVHALFEWQNYIGYGGLVVAILIPMFLALVAIVRKKGVQNIPYEGDSKDKKNQQDAKQSGSEKNGNA